MCKGDPPNFEIYIYIYIIILTVSKFSLKNKSWPPPNIWFSPIMFIKKKKKSNNYRDITLFFTILFFIIKYALIFVKYLIKFDIKHILIYIFFNQLCGN